MKLSTLYTTVPDYIEFAWVTTPDAAEQNISAHTITTLTLDTEVADTGNLVSAPASNQFTLPAGTYYFEATSIPIATALSSGLYKWILSLNKSDGTYITRQASISSNGGGPVFITELSGQFELTGSTALELRILSNRPLTITSLNPTMTDSTANADQRTTIKLWKLK